MADDATTLTETDVANAVLYVARRVRNETADASATFPAPGDGAVTVTDPPSGPELDMARAALNMCFHHAGCAPYRVGIEAAIRCAGWLRDNDPAVAARDVTDGTSITPRAAASGALRGSGAMAMLSPYRVRRLAVVGED